ncbi:MAG: MBL fold metallo-hydrolase, partial [Clostridia bacterium]|nr:MBL fold metallo-hydrolase [Clostridia bacterium]
MVNVGQGDCILILFPDGKDMLIDCANYNNTASIRNSAFAYIDMYVTDKQFDYVMLTHCDSDHVYFLDEVLDTYQVD